MDLNTLFRFASSKRSFLVFPALVLGAVGGAQADTGDIFTTTATDLSVGSNYTVSITPTAASTTDVQLSGTYGTITLNANGTALVYGTLDDLNTTQSLVITNNSGTAGSIQLSSVANVTAGANAADLLFVKAGANLTIQSGAGTLTLIDNVSGNIDNAGTLTISGPMTIAAGTTTTFIGTGATTISGNIGATTGAVTINDAGGSVTLGGVDSYTGATTIDAGSTLSLSGSLGNTAISVTAGTLNIGAGTATGLINSTGTLSLSSGTVNYTSTGGTTSTLGGLNLSTAGANVITGTAGDTLNLGTVTRGVVGATLDIGATGAVTTSTGNNSGGILGGFATYGGTTWAVSNGGSSAITGLASGSYAASTAGSTLFATTADVDFQASNTTAFNTQSIISLRFNTGAATTMTIGSVLTDSTGGILETSAVGNNATTITGGEIAGSTGDLIVIQNNTSNSLTIASSIINNGATTGLTKSGAGTLILSAANYFTGAVTVNSGLLAVTNQLAFNSANSIAVGSGATVDFQSVNETIENLGNVSGLGGTITDSTGTTVLTIANGNGSTYSGIISGANLSLVLNSGTQTLSGADTYGGGTTINGGTLSINGNILGTGTLTLAGGTLSYTTGFTLTNNIIAAAGTNSTFNQGAGVSLTTSGLSGDGTINSAAGNAFGGLDLGGNNAAFAGQYNSSGSGNARDKISSATAGSDSAIFNLSGATDTSSTNFTSAGTLYYGALEGSASNARNDTSVGTTYNIGALNMSTTWTGDLGAQVGQSSTFLVKVGTGTLTISAVQGLSGGLTVQGGTLSLTASGTNVVFASQGLTLDGGTLLDSGASTATEAFSSTTLKLGGSGVTTATGDGHVTTLGAITHNAGGVVNFVPLSTTAAAAGSITTTTANNSAGIIGGFATINGSDWATGGGTIGTYSAYTTLTAAGGGTQTATNFSYTATGTGATTLTAPITANSLKIVDSGTGDSLNDSGNSITFNGTAGGLLMTGGGSYTISGAGIVGAGASSEFITNVNGGSTLTIGSQLIGNGTSGSLTKAGGGTLILSGTNNYTGLTTIDGGLLNLGSSGAIGTGSISFGGGTLQYSASNTTDYSSQIVNSTGAISIDTNGQNITFASALNSTYAPSTNSFTGNIGGLTMSDSTGTGSLTLSGANTYIGATTINSGALDITGSGTLGNTNGFYYNLLTLNGGTLNLGGTTQTTGVVNLNGGTLTNGTLAGLAYNSTNTSGTATVSAILSGNNVGVGLSKSGVGGTLLLTGANTYNGQTTITGGALQLGNANAVQNSTVSISVANGLTFSTGIGTFNIGELSGASNELLTDTGSNAVTLSVGGNNTSTTYSGVLSGSGGLTKTGTGTLTLSGANTFTGGTIISGGTISVTANTALGGAGGTAGAVTVNGGTLAWVSGTTDTHAITIGASGGTFQPDASNTGAAGTGQLRFNTASTLLGTGTLTIIGNGTITTTGSGNVALNSAQTFAGNIVLQNGGSVEYAVANALGAGATVTLGNQGEFIVDTGLTVSNNVTVTGGANSILSFNNGTAGIYSGTLTMNADTIVNLSNWYNGSVQGGTISGQITGTGAFTVNSGSGSGGTLTITNANNNYTGTTTITSSTLTVGGAGVLGAGNYAGAIINNNGTFNYNSSATQALSGIITGSGAIKDNGTGPLTITPGTSSNYTGTLATAAGATLNLTGANSLTTSSTYTGAITDAGTINLNQSGSQTLSGNIADSGTINYNGTGTQTLSGNITATGTANFGGSGTQTITGNIANSGTVNFNETGSQTFSGAISGSGALKQTGSGTLTVSGSSNTFTGGTTVSAGTLSLTGSINTTTAISVTGGSLLFTSTANVNTSAPVSLNGTGTLGFSGTQTNASAGFGALTLVSGSSSTVTFGSVGTGNTILFNQGSTALGLTTGTTLNVYDWIAAGSVYTSSSTDDPASNANQDALLFNGTVQGTDIYSNVKFYSDNGSTFIGYGGEVSFAESSSEFEIVPITTPAPESSSLLAALGLLGLLNLRRIKNVVLNKARVPQMV